MSLVSLLHREETRSIKSICHSWQSWVMDLLGMDHHLLLHHLALLAQVQDLLLLDHLVVVVKINHHQEELCLHHLEETGDHLEDHQVATTGLMEDHLLVHLGQVLNLLCLNLCSHLGVETRRMETVGVVTMTGTIHLHLLETCLHGQVVKEDLLDILVLHLHHHPKDPAMEAATAGVCLHGLVFPHHLLVVKVVLQEAQVQFLHLLWATGTKDGVSHNLEARTRVNSPTY